MNSCPPYRPIRGALPPHFVDRPPSGAVDGQGLVTSTVAGLRNGVIDPRFHQAVSAGPGMGKTAFAEQVASRTTAELGWLSALHHCPSLGASLSALTHELTMLFSTHAHRSTHAQPSQLCGEACRCRGAHPAGRGRMLGGGMQSGAGDEPILSDLLMRAGRRLSDAGRGVIVIVDDADRLRAPELQALVSVAGEIRRSRLPIALLLTTSANCVSSRREVIADGSLWQESLDVMNAEESAEALAVPAARKGITFAAGALEAMHEFSGGRPLDVQRAGFVAWSCIARGTRISGAAARRALHAATTGDERKAS